MEFNKSECRCKKTDCIYKALPYLPYGCDYSSITGELRVAGLPRDKWAPELCDKYVSGKRSRNVKRPPEPKPFDSVTAKGFYDKGLNDTEIARQMGETYRRVQDWRTRNNLPRNSAKLIIDESKAAELYRQGLYDGEIGTELGCSKEKIRRWRIENNLPAIGKPGGRNPPKGKIDLNKALELYQQGLTDGRIAEELGCCSSAIQHWRKARNLPSKNLPKPKTDWSKAAELYAAGMSDEQIARKVGCKAETVRCWRTRTKRKALTALAPMKQEPCTDEDFRALHERGLLDAEIAVVLGISYAKVRRDKKRMGLGANNAGCVRKKAILFDGKAIHDGFGWDEATRRYWIFVNGYVRAIAKTLEEAAKMYEEVRGK